MLLRHDIIVQLPEQSHVKPVVEYIKLCQSWIQIPPLSISVLFVGNRLKQWHSPDYQYQETGSSMPAASCIDRGGGCENGRLV